VAAIGSRDIKKPPPCMKPEFTYRVGIRYFTQITDEPYPSSERTHKPSRHSLLHPDHGPAVSIKPEKAHQLWNRISG
jgi:hypothetical protein